MLSIVVIGCTFLTNTYFVFLQKKAGRKQNTSGGRVFPENGMTNPKYAEDSRKHPKWLASPCVVRRSASKFKFCWILSHGDARRRMRCPMSCDYDVARSDWLIRASDAGQRMPTQQHESTLNNALRIFRALSYTSLPPASLLYFASSCARSRILLDSCHSSKRSFSVIALNSLHSGFPRSDMFSLDRSNHWPLLWNTSGRTCIMVWQTLH